MRAARVFTFFEPRLRQVFAQALRESPLAADEIGMGKRSLRKVFDKKLAERRKLNPDMQKLLLSFDAEYGHPEKGNAPAPRGKADHGEGASSQ